MTTRAARRALIGVVCGAVFGITPWAAAAQVADPLEGRPVIDIQVSGQRRLSSDAILGHLASRVGEPFHRSTLERDRRRLDELRLFTSVSIQPRAEREGVALDVSVTETLRLLPVVIIRVTDENGISAGPGLRAINLLGGGAQAGVAVRFGGETGVAATVDSTTITPGTWMRHLAFTYSSRRNTIYDFAERATSVEGRLARNWRHGLRTGVAGEILSIDTGSSGASLSQDGTDVIPTIGGFLTVDTLDSSTNPRHGSWAEIEIDRLFGDADSWSVILDARRFQRLSARHGLSLSTLATLQSGTLGTQLPYYLQFALGGANTVRGWSLNSRSGRNQLIGTVEYTYVLQPIRAFSVAGLNLYGGLQVVAFGDLGLAWNDRTDLDQSPALDGYGIGLRALVPFVDVIRLDLAWGEPERGASASFGVSLKAARQRQRVR